MFSQQGINYLTLGMAGQAVLAALAALPAIMQLPVDAARLRDFSRECPLPQ